MKIEDYSGSGDYLFASNLSGVEFRLLDDELHEAEDVDGDVHGKWLHVQTEDFEDGYLSAVGELVQELQRLGIETGGLYKVTRCVKSGTKETAPYEVNVEALEPDQSRL